jgi:hypothetical protein
MNEKHLRSLSIFYLLAPNLLFFTSWVNMPIGVAGIIVLLYLSLKEVKDASFGAVKILDTSDLLTIGFASVFLTVVSGINGYVFQNVDYWAHNVKFYELLTHKWPIRIPADGPVISYYYGFYVIPALASKLTGAVNETFIFLWTWLGLSIGIAWLYVVLNKKILFVWLTLCIGDLPRVIKSFLSIFSVRLYEFGNFGIENWSNFENLLWVPNQIIPTLIIGGMFVYVLMKRLQIDLLVLPIALSFWWAVFPAFVCGLLVGGLVVRGWFQARFQIRLSEAFNRVIIPFLVCLPVLIFYLSHDGELVSGFLWEFTSNPANSFAEYLVNIVINAVLFLTAYLYFRRIGLPSLTQIPFFCIVFLQLFFPIYRLGEVSDFLFRGMMPFLLIIGLYLFYPLTRDGFKATYSLLRSSGWGMFLTSMLVLSSVTGTTQLYRAARINRLSDNQGVKFEPIPYDAYANVYEVIKAKWSPEGADQYLGNAGSFYEKYMAPDLRKGTATKRQE